MTHHDAQSIISILHLIFDGVVFIAAWMVGTAIGRARGPSKFRRRRFRKYLNKND